MYIDVKIATWQRINLNGGKKLSNQEVIDFLEKNSLDDISYLKELSPYSHTTWSREYMSPKENNMAPTIELYDDYGIKIWDNSHIDKVYSFRAGNQIIAEFMGFEFRDDENQYYHIEEGYYLCTPEELMYHRSWDWFMDVVRKCNELPYEDNFRKGMNDAVTSADLNKAWESCVKYIKWFNKNKLPIHGQQD